MPRKPRQQDQLRKPSKKWDDTEEVNILMYMKDVVAKGLAIEVSLLKDRWFILLIRESFVETLRKGILRKNAVEIENWRCNSSSVAV